MIDDEFDHWNDAVRSICGRFATSPSRELPVFVGQIGKSALGSLSIARIRTNAERIRHQRALSTDGEFCFLVLQQRGFMSVCHADGGFRLDPGDIAFLDSAHDFEMRPDGLIGQISVHLSRQALDRVAPGAARGLNKLSQQGISAQLLRNLLQRLADGAAPDAPGGDEEGSALELALIHLMQPALAMRAEEEGALPLRLLANAVIERSLGDPELSPRLLAERMRISERQLYRVFNADGDSVFRYIMRQRLERSAADLLQYGPAARTVTDVAFVWGFVDSAHFSRAFKRHFGVSPSDYRRRGGGHDAPAQPLLAAGSKPAAATDKPGASPGGPMPSIQ